MPLLLEPRIRPDARPFPEALDVVSWGTPWSVVRDERPELVAWELVTEAAVLDAPAKAASYEVALSLFGGGASRTLFEIVGALATVVPAARSLRMFRAHSSSPRLFLTLSSAGAVQAGGDSKNLRASFEGSPDLFASV